MEGNKIKNTSDTPGGCGKCIPLINRGVLKDPGWISRNITSSDQVLEAIVGIVPYTLKGNVFPGAVNVSLILTTRRILCVRTDSFIVTNWWGIEHTNAITDYFRLMHPNDIVARYPDSVVIPVNDIVSTVVRYESNILSLDINWPWWRITITTRSMTFELITTRKPYDLLESARVKKVLGTRLHLH